MTSGLIRHTHPLGFDCVMAHSCGISPLYLDKPRRVMYNSGQDMNTLEHIREQVRANNYEFSLHAEHEREDEHILVNEIEQSVLSGMLLEEYPDDPRGHSCLILGFTETYRAIHSYWSLLPDGRVRVITVYIPLPPKWIDPRTRRRRDHDDV